MYLRAVECVCELCRLYCTYNICSACPESLICFQFTFLPGDFYRSTLINHRVIYIKAAPCSGSRNHAMVTEVKFKTAGKWPRTDMYLRRQHFKESYLTMHSRYVSFMWSLGDPWVTDNLGITDPPVYHSNALVPLTLTICYLIKKTKSTEKSLNWHKKTTSNHWLTRIHTLNSNIFFLCPWCLCVKNVQHMLLFYWH